MMYNRCPVLTFPLIRQQLATRMYNIIMYMYSFMLKTNALRSVMYPCISFAQVINPYSEILAAWPMLHYLSMYNIFWSLQIILEYYSLHYLRMYNIIWSLTLTYFSFNTCVVLLSCEVKPLGYCRNYFPMEDKIRGRESIQLEDGSAIPITAM